MKSVASLVSPRIRLAGITALSSIALFSSLYLQYVAGYQPCVYCYVLRYLTLGILGVSVFGILGGRWVPDASTVISGASLVGVGVSVYLVADELFPTAGICRACAFAPFVLGLSLYYYSLVFMGMVFGLSITIALEKH